MAKWSVTKRIEFDAAHRLSDYDGKCANLHGHRYVAELTYSTEKLDKQGFVIDFTEIKNGVGRWIDENWDHATIAHRGNSGISGKVFVLHENPTAENMVAYLYGVAAGFLREKELDALIVLERVRIYETPGSWADYEE